MQNPQAGEAPLAAKIGFLYFKWKTARENDDQVNLNRIVDKILYALGISIQVSAKCVCARFPIADLDLIQQAGRLAVVPALENYDPDRTRTAHVCTYLLGAINGAMKAEAVSAAERDRKTRTQIVADIQDADSDDWTGALDIRAVLDQYIDRLGLDQRIVLRKRFHEQFTYDEIAQLIGCSERSVRRVEAAALAQLRALIGDSCNIR